MTLPRPLTVTGITGLAGDGKDTVADLLRTHCGARTLAFADALRQEIVDAFCIEELLLTRRATKELPLPALALNNCTDRAFVDRMVVHYMAGAIDGGVEGERISLTAPRSPRQIMQWWGTEYRRSQNDAYWVSHAHQHMQWLSKSQHADLVVLSDVRFVNEANLVRRWGGQIWQIKRPGLGLAHGAHASEVTGDHYAPDAVIVNAHDSRHLQAQVLSVWAARALKVPGLTVQVPA